MTIKERHVARANAIVARRLEHSTGREEEERVDGVGMRRTEKGAERIVSALMTWGQIIIRSVSLLARVIYGKSPRSSDMKLQLCRDKVRNAHRSRSVGLALRSTGDTFVAPSRSATPREIVSLIQFLKLLPHFLSTFLSRARRMVSGRYGRIRAG